MVLGALALFCMITRLWPLLFLVIPGIIITAIRLLFISAKKEISRVAPPEAFREPPRQNTEQDVVRIAFGILQRRVTEQVTSRYPAARWIWETPNTIERFTEDMPLTIMLNRAGGFRKAAVHVYNLQFRSIVYETASGGSDEAQDSDFDGEPEHEETLHPDESVDYALVAFQWVEANLLALNNRCNDAIAKKEPFLLIHAHGLPHPDSWREICSELTRNGFNETIIQADGICVTIPKQ